MKNIVIINSSPRKDGNSEILAKSFADGAKEAGNNVEFINPFGFDPNITANTIPNAIVLVTYGMKKTV